MTEVITEMEEILDKGPVIETEESIFHSQADQEVTVTHEGHTNVKSIIEVTADNNCTGINLYHQLENLELHQCLLAEIKIDVSVADSLVILPKIVMRRMFLQSRHNIKEEKISRHKG